MPISAPEQLLPELKAFGVEEPLFLPGSKTPKSVKYLDLIPGGGGRVISERIYPDAVVEWQNKPLLYVTSHANLGQEQIERDQNLRQLRRMLGSRGERAYLGILEPGQLSVIPVSLSSMVPDFETYKAGTGEALTFFSRLANGDYPGNGEPKQADYVYAEMLKLLNHVADKLVGDQRGIQGSDVLSLVGRALFFRFLCDRGIVTEASRRAIAPNAQSLKHCFTSPENFASTSAWLDRTFNGDFMPLLANDSTPTMDGQEARYQSWFSNFSDEAKTEICSHLTAIIEGFQPAGSQYQNLFDWAKFDFAHVPIGLLSQVYEAFSWKWSPDAKGTSVHYTPRNIANYLVEEAFHELPNASTAKVLDPACGAGVFLVLAFKKLCEERWKQSGERPDTKEIREILESQLVGFDVSENAIRLSALSLYLTAIELDPSPSPPSKLRFKNLRDNVLFNFRAEDDPQFGPVLGSVSDAAMKNHKSGFDVVLCNPPWTSLAKDYKPIAEQMDKISREVLSLRSGCESFATKYRNPDNVPDLPFLWRATEWCRPDGRIGMVLPGRNLFKQEDIPTYAREVLFRSLAVTGILNCSNLSDTKVWPDMNQPFFLLFAQNRLPREEATMRWVTPYYDETLNGKGEIRIDSESIQLINIEQTFQEPWLWKGMSVGTSLDIEIIRKIKKRETKTLEAYWKDELGLKSVNGYQIVENQTQSSASFLIGLPDLNDTRKFSFIAEPKQLTPFKRLTLFRPRKRENYKAPLVLVFEAPGLDRENGRALISLNADIAFNESFHGYSSFGFKEGEKLVRYLQLFVHSNLWLHYVLLTSPTFGVERRKIKKADLDRVGFLPFENLTEQHIKKIGQLSDKLLKENPTVFSEIDDFFAEIYGLSKLEIQTVNETVSVTMPFAEIRTYAGSKIDENSRKQFSKSVESTLRPFFKKHSKLVKFHHTQNPEMQEESPYVISLIGTEAAPPEIDESLTRKILALATESGASRIIWEVEPNLLLVGIANQKRFFTKSRARLLAAEILNYHMETFHN